MQNLLSKKGVQALRLRTDGIITIMLGEWRSGQLTLPTLCMIFVLFALLMTQGLSSLLSKTINSETNQFLSADAILTTPYKIPEDLRTTLQDYPIEIAETVTTTTVILSNQQTLLVGLKGVSQEYPIKPGLTLFANQQRTQAKPHTASKIVESGPRLGEAWVDPAVLDRLGLRIGDPVIVGHHSLTITEVIEFEPDRSMRFYSLNPRIMIAAEDLEQTGIIQPASRATYRLLIGGQPAIISQLIQAVSPTLDAHQTLKHASDNNPLIQRSVSRANQFLLIVGGLAAGIALAGFWLVLDRVARRLAPTIATLRCLGMSQIQLSVILFSALGSMVIVSLVCVLPLCALTINVGAHLSTALNGPTIDPAATEFLNPLTLLGTLLLVIGLGWLKLKTLLSISPALAIRSHGLDSDRHDRAQSSTLIKIQHKVFAGLIPATCILSGALFYIAPITTAFTQLIQLLIGSAAMVLLAFFLARLLTKFVWSPLAKRDLKWELTIAQWLNLSNLNHFQVALFSLIVMGGSVTFILKNDLFDRWQRTLPAETPNYFIANLFSEDLPAFKDLLTAKNITHSTIYPINRGRLIKQNQQLIQKPVTKESSQERPAFNAVRRELNLTWSTELPENNQITSGRWWQLSDYGKPVISIEAELADKLDIRIGDILTFSMAGEIVDAEVLSIRTVQWDSFTPNFYVIFAPRFFDEATATFMASLYLPPESNEANTINSLSLSISAQIAQQFPHVSLYSVGPILEQIRHILGYVAGALSGALIFLSIAGTLLLIAMIFSSWDERQQTLKVIHIIGGSPKTITAITLREYLILALSVGGIGCLGGEFIAAMLSERIFDITPTIHPTIWLLGMLWTLCLFISVGFIASRFIKRHER